MYCDFPDFGRCCVCLPLRRGVLLFAYLNIIVTIIQLVEFILVHNSDVDLPLIYHGSVAPRLEVLSLVLLVLEIIANCVLLYGVHLKRVIFIKVFYYYAITATVASVLIWFSVAIIQQSFLQFEILALLFAGICIQLYLIALVNSLIRHLQITGNNGSNAYENRLQQIVAGEVYEPTVVPNETA